MKLALAAVVAVLIAAAWFGSSPSREDPGVRACREIGAGQVADRAVGGVAARSGVPALALSGARLRDAGSGDEVEAASAQLTRVCRAWSAR